MGSQSVEHNDREKLKKTVLERPSRDYQAFIERFNALGLCNDQEALSAALEILWQHLPRREDLDVLEDIPYDGLLYDQEYVKQARKVLEDLSRAWQDSEIFARCQLPPRLQKMSKIFLILKGMQEPIFLTLFLESGLTDDDLRLDKARLSEVFIKEEHRNYVELFYREQSRAVPREWAEGSHSEFDEGEPMPLEFIVEAPLGGAFGQVMKVRDLSTDTLCVRKQQHITTNKCDMQSNMNHINQEIQRLKGLEHHHVVQFVKSYRRGQAYGLIIRPAAQADLSKLFEKYDVNKYNHKKKRHHRDWLRPIFLMAFGCLAQGLAYIHGQNLRHKDVKPDNILFEYAGDSGRFLWADFGLAYDFSDKEDSKTRSTKLYSPRYAPPEVVAANATEQSKPVVKLDAIQEDGQEMLRTQMHPEASNEEVEAHGRAADRFALGCVYFDLLSRLVKDDLPLEKGPQGKIMFSSSIQKLHAWAHEKKASNEFLELHPIFDIAVTMIQRDPSARPDMTKIIDAVVRAGKAFYCERCSEDYRPQEPAKKDLKGIILVDPPLSPKRPPSPQGRMSRTNSGLSFTKKSRSARRLSRG